MSQDTPQVTAARIEAERTRARLMETAHDLQARLKPKTLAQNAWEGAKVKGSDFADDAVDAVRKRPLAAGGIAAGLTFLLAWKPLKSLFGKHGNETGSKRSSDDSEPRVQEIAIFETERSYDEPTAAGPAAELERARKPVGGRSRKSTTRV